MSTPFIWIGINRIKEGRLDEARQRVAEITAVVEEQEPRLQAFHFYLDENDRRLVCLQVHPDPESMATHMGVIAAHLTSAWDWLEQESSASLALGTPPEIVTRYVTEFDEDMTVYPTHAAGFTRVGTTPDAVRASEPAAAS